MLALGEPTGQGWAQIGELALALLLSSLIGLEREARQKSAGLRTHAIVGVGSALFVLVSKYGFTDVLVPNKVVLDPSRVAAQIVSGIGFIGGGLIFVRRDAVRGLTTAAVVWLTAAVGATAGAGLPVLAVAATAGNFLVIYGLGPLARRLPLARSAPTQLQLTYQDGRGLLRDLLTEITGRGYTVGELTVTRGAESREGSHRGKESGPETPDGRSVTVVMEVTGTGHVPDLVAALSDIDGLTSVTAGDENDNRE
jgi:putative Mg2+ transporter-C (MgtC) family protein